MVSLIFLDQTYNRLHSNRIDISGFLIKNNLLIKSSPDLFARRSFLATCISVITVNMRFVLEFRTKPNIDLYILMAKKINLNFFGRPG